MVVERNEENALTHNSLWRHDMRLDLVPCTYALDLTAYTSTEAVLHAGS